MIKRTLNRLSLLVADPERVEALEDITNPHPCLAWLAGAERYRLLRQLLRGGEVELVKGVVRRLDRRDSVAMVGAQGRLAALPGLADIWLDSASATTRRAFRRSTASGGRPGPSRWAPCAGSMT